MCCLTNVTVFHTLLRVDPPSVPGVQGLGRGRGEVLRTCSTILEMLIVVVVVVVVVSSVRWGDLHALRPKGLGGFVCLKMQ